MKKYLLSTAIAALFSSGYAVSSEPLHYYIIASQAQPFQIEEEGGAHEGVDYE